MKVSRGRSRSRPGTVATMEALISLGTSMPLAVAMLAFALKVTRAFYQSAATLICWPYT